MVCGTCGSATGARDGRCPVCGTAHASPVDSPTQPLDKGGADAGVKAVLAGRYEVIREIGRGGMGVVHLAREVELDRLVAVKVLPVAQGADGKAAQRFAQEARLAARLRHPGIVSVHAIGESSGWLYFTMDYIEGETLETLVQRRKGLPETEARPMLAAIVRAVGHAHASGVIHRDLKPSNILVDRTGHVLVTDFGLARDQSGAGLSSSGVVLGTPLYMSPEQIEGGAASPATDVYALGLIYYFMRTGEHLACGDGVASVIAQHLSGAPRARAASDRRLSPSDAALLLPMIERSPEGRVGTASALLAALDSGAALPPPRAWSEAPVRPRIGRVGVLVVAALLLATGIAIAIRYPPRASRGVQTVASATPVRRQITHHGEATLPEPSPDGAFLAYVVRLPDRTVKVMLDDLLAGSSLELAHLNGVFDLEWSPDGAHLLVAAWTRDGRYPTLLIPRLGGAAREMDSAGYVSWAPDGRRFVSASMSTARPMRITDLATGAVRTVEVAGGVDFVAGLHWEPAGERVLLWGTKGPRQLMMVLEDGTLRTVLEEAPRDRIQWATWTRDGSGVYYLKEAGSTFDLWWAPVGSSALGAPRLVTSDVDPPCALSRDGKRLAYVDARVDNKLWRMRASPSPDAPSAPEPLTAGTRDEDRPSLSPDGTRIAFYRRGSEGADVFVMPVEGGEARQLTHEPSILGGPAWSPDGARLLFASITDERIRLRIADVTTGTLRDLSAPDQSESLVVAWPAPSLVLYATTGNRNFAALDIETGERRRLLTDAQASQGWSFHPVPSPDGSRVAMYRNIQGGGPECWIVPIAGGEGLSVDLGVPMGWTADGRYLFVAEGREPVRVVIGLDTASGGRAAKYLPKPVAGDEPWCSTVDGETFVCGVTTTTSDVWIIDNFDALLPAPAP